MRWLKRDMWKAGIAIAGMLLLLVLMTWIPFLAVGAHGKLQSGPAFAVGTGTAQATSTVDLTVTALAKDQLQQQDEKLQRENSGLWPFWATVSDSIGGSIGGLGTACLAIAAYVTARYGLRQWHVNRQDEQKKREEKQERWRKEREEKQRKRDEERFQIVVERLSREREEARVGGAIVLRTFLQEGYEQFYSQAFDLAVAHLCLSKASDPLKDPDVLSQALIGVFKEAFPLARDEWIKKQKGEPFPPRSRSWSRSLDASRIQLDKAFLWNADLKEVWMPEASLRGADLSEAKFSDAKVWRADLSEVMLWGADLSHADFGGANFSRANLSHADLSEVTLWGANLSEANLSHANLSEANLIVANLSEANLSRANLSGADLSGADLSRANLSHADLSEAKLNGADLHDADLSGAKLSGAKLMAVQLSGADLSRTDLHEVDLSRVQVTEVDLSRVQVTEVDLSRVQITEVNLSRAALNWDALRRWTRRIKVADSGVEISSVDLDQTTLLRAYLEDARSLEGTDLHGVKGLTKEQLEICKARGAIVGEDTTTSSPRSTVSPSPSSQSNDVQSPLATPAQGNLPTPDTGISSATSSQQGPEP